MAMKGCMKERLLTPAACWVLGWLAEGIRVEHHYGIPRVKD